MRYVVLLRGVNLGPTNRVAMPALRDALGAAGFAEHVRTYVQSGNVVLESKLTAAELERRCGEVVKAEFGLDVAIVSRTRAQLANVVAADPLAEHVTDPKRYQVCFLGGRLAAGVVERLQGLAELPERLVVADRELYAWHPNGIGRSKLWNGVAGKLGVVATARNWKTVTTLLQMASD